MIKHIIMSIRKRYWRKVIINGGIPVFTACDLVIPPPEKAYALFSESELEEIQEVKQKNRDRIRKMIDEL